MKRIIAALLAYALVAVAPALAQPYNLTVAGYSPGGLISTVGAGLDAALAAAYPGSTVTYQTSSGGLANAMLLHEEKVPIGFIGDHELIVAVEGRPPINQKLSDLRMLFRPYTAASRFQATHVLVHKSFAEEHGIKTFADLGAKKPKMSVAVNRPGNMDGDVSLAALAAVGLTEDVINAAGGQVVRAASREMTSLMLDRRIDVAVLGISYNHPRIREMANGVELVMLPMTDEVAKQVADQTGAEPCPIKADEYAFLAEDTPTACVGMGIYANASMDDETAYNIVKGVVEQVEKFKAAHRLLAGVVTEQTLSQGGLAPHHPGAEMYYREKGLIQ